MFLKKKKKKKELSNISPGLGQLVDVHCFRDQNCKSWHRLTIFGGKDVEEEITEGKLGRKKQNKFQPHQKREGRRGKQIMSKTRSKPLLVDTINKDVKKEGERNSRICVHLVWWWRRKMNKLAS